MSQRRGEFQRSYKPKVMRNIAHLDEIRKANVLAGARLQRQWPATWGFLQQEYETLRHLSDERRLNVIMRHAEMHPENELIQKMLVEAREKMAQNVLEMEQMLQAEHIMKGSVETYWGTQLPSVRQPDGSLKKGRLILPNIPLTRNQEVGWSTRQTELYKYDKQRRDSRPIGDINKRLGWPKGDCF